MKELYFQFRSNFWLHLFTLNLRNLLGVGFVIGGLRKVNGHPFANIGQGGPFFNFLDALHENLIYYEFIGWAQFIAGALLITQRYATVGAMIYFPIILNIMVFTVFSIGSLTPYIASLMCLGTLYLLLWDYNKWMNIFKKDNDLYLMSTELAFPTYDKKWLINGWITLILPFISTILLFLFGYSGEHTKMSKYFFVASLGLVIISNIVVNLLSLKEKLKG